MIKITAEWNKEHLACYPDKRLARLYDRPMELRDVLTRKDGPWDEVPAKDRMWVFWRAATQAQQAATLERIVTRAVTNHCLTCGIAAVEKWAAKWLSGEDRSGKAAKAAERAARAARATRATRAAEWAAECAEWAECAECAAVTTRWAATAAEWAARAARAAVITEWAAEWAARAAVITEWAEEWAAEWAARAAAERDLQLLDALDVLDDTETIAALDAAEGEG